MRYCNHRYRQECCGLTKDVFDVLINLIDQTGWTCIECRKTKSTHRCKLQSVVERLTDQLADVHISLAYMKGEIDELKLKLSVNLTPKDILSQRLRHTRLMKTIQMCLATCTEMMSPVCLRDTQDVVRYHKTKEKCCCLWFV